MGSPPLVTVGGFELRVRPWLALATAIGVALTVGLGGWQLGRAQYKDNLQQRLLELGRAPPITLGPQAIRAEDVALRRVEVRGRFEPKFAIYLDNRFHQHRPGYHVVMPLNVAGSGRYVLVNRGWIAASGDRSRPPPVATPQGEIALQGVAQVPSERFLELSSRVAEGDVWQNLALDRYRAVTGLDLHPIVVQQDSAASDGLVRAWVPLDSGRNTHLAYAFQWFALGVAILVCYFVLNVRRQTQAVGPR